MNKKTAKICYIIEIILLIAILGTLVFGYIKKKNTNIPNPIVTMEVENYGTIKMELYPDVAPETVKNFIKLIQSGFYNNVTFHRVVKDFMIQGGAPNEDGTGSATFADLYNNQDENATYNYSTGKEAKSTDSYTIPGEFVANGYNENNLNLTEGCLAMARSDYTNYSATLSSESYDSGCSQFFIMTTNDNTALSGYYTGFGKVIEGMDVVHKIENVECKAASSDENSENGEESTSSGEISTPVEKIVIKSVSVETNGIDYGMPVTLEPWNYTKWLYSLYGMTYTGE